jgi:hypothetical protein
MQPGSPVPQVNSLERMAAARELFWQNVLREMLTSLSILCASKSKQPGGVAVDGQLALAPGDHSKTDLFDGRLAVITTLGQRIPIASVYPLFACGIQTSDAEKALSTAVECTVFQVVTPGGEVFTLPLQEIRSFHSLSEQLIEEIKAAATQRVGSEHEPFGFAAYTSLARAGERGQGTG